MTQPVGHDFSGARVIVTGAASGIGRATARAFAVNKANVIATDVDGAELASLETEAGKAGLAIKGVSGDLTDPAFVSRLVESAGDVDILVNCAGWVRHTPFLDSDPRDWERVYAINVIALLRLTQLVARGMVARRSGHIFNVSSILARRVYPYTLAYAGTKHAVRAISEGLAVELQSSGVKVTEIAPGLTETNIFRDINSPEVLESYARFQFPKLKPDEIARAILYAAAAPEGACPAIIAVNPMGQA